MESSRSSSFHKGNYEDVIAAAGEIPSRLLSLKCKRGVRCATMWLATHRSASASAPVGTRTDSGMLTSNFGRVWRDKSTREEGRDGTPPGLDSPGRTA